MHFILSLLSAIALLAYGVSVAKGAMLRACGASLGTVVNSALNSRMRAAAVGLITTMLLQSSTATSLLVSSFLKKGILTLGTALAIMLGADLGTAIMARILTYDLSLLCPLLLTVGTVFYLSSETRPRLGNIGGVLVGLGLILLALSLIVKATQPVIHSDLTAMLLQSLTGEIAFSLILGTVLAVLCYSSLAAVLLTSLLSSGGSIEPASALAVVIGSNLGSCLLEILGALRQGLAARRVMLGNTLFKLALGILCLPALPWIARVDALPLSEGVIWFHVCFNALVCFLMLPLAGKCSRLLYLMIPEVKSQVDPNAPKHLDKSAYADPQIALSNATREILSLGDFLQQMMQNLHGTIDGRPATGEQSRDLKSRIRSIASEVSDYLSGINCVGSKQRHQLQQCLLASVNITEAAKQENDLEKRIRKVMGNHGAACTKEDREALSRLAEGSAQTLGYALNAFLYNGDEQRQRYYQSRAATLRNCTSHATEQYGSKTFRTGLDVRFGMGMLEILDHFRQLTTSFDDLFARDRSGGGDDEEE